MSEDRGDALEELKRFRERAWAHQGTGGILSFERLEAITTADRWIAAWEKERSEARDARIAATKLEIAYDGLRHEHTALRAAIEKVEGEMRADGAKDYGDGADRIAGSTAIAWANALKSARLGEGV